MSHTEKTNLPENPKTLEIFYGISSPWAYLGWPRAKAVAQKNSAAIRLRPIRVIEANGGIMLRSRPEPRQDYHAIELNRWRHFLNMPLNLRPKFYPCRTIEHAAKCVIAMQRAGHDAQEISFRIQRALWAEDRDIADIDVLKAIVTEVAGASAANLVQLPYPDPVTTEWLANLADAETLGIFGTPTYVVAGELFWGQDRLDFVDRKLAQMA